MADFFLLGFLGGHPAEEPYITASRLASVFYFGFFIAILPLTSILEQIVVATERVPGDRPEDRITQEKKVTPPGRDALDTLETRRRRRRLDKKFMETYQEERE